MSNLITQTHSYSSKNNLKNRSFNFSLVLIDYTSHLPSNQTLRVIINQLLRSGTSIGANIIEAKSASSKKDFLNYYQISLKSTNETIYWLLLLKEGHLDNSIKLDKLVSEAKQLAAMLASSILTMKGKRKL